MTSSLVSDQTSRSRPDKGVAVPTGRRLDIQGLRAVAVLMVVAFHAGLPVPGGFVGVDVFFVISGFVITAMLVREHATHGRVRFGAFYLRRFKRLTPALAVTVAVTMVATFALLSPFGTQQTAASTGLGAMLLVANLVISRSTGDYFDAPAEANPLLNTWSLSVEEQFYLIFPAIIGAAWWLSRRAHRWRRAPLAAVSIFAIGSFALAVVGSRVDLPFTGFYSPFTRAWEFAAGALIALLASRVARLPRRTAPLAGVVGVILLAVSLWAIDGSTPFPGLWTLVPVVGTMLLIIAGGVHDTNPVTAALATRSMAKIGDWSYSIYLWHWPFIVFAVYLWPQTPQIRLVAAVLSLAVALASYYWVEQPLRSLPQLSRPRMTAVIAAVVLPPVVLSIAVGVGANRLWLPKYDSGAFPVAHEGDIGHLDIHTYVDNTYYPCADEAIRANAPTWEGITRCHQSKPDVPVDFVIVGDSHAEHLFLGLAESMPDRNVAYYILGAKPVRESGEDMARIIDTVAASPAIRSVLVNSYWDARGVPAGLSETLGAFTASGKKVYVTDDVPSFPFDPVQCKYQKSPLIAVTECSTSADANLEAYDTFYPQLAADVAAVPGVQLLNTNHHFCGPETCDMNSGNLLLYRDPDHLNINGTRYLATKLLADYPQVATG